MSLKSAKKKTGGIVRSNESRNVFYKRVPFKGGEIVVMNHPASIILYKYVQVEVLCGTVSVFGYEITPRSEPLKVFSHEKTGLIELKSNSGVGIWSSVELMNEVEDRMRNILNVYDGDPVSDLLSTISNCTAVIHIQRIELPVNVEFFDLYYPRVLAFNLYQKSRRAETLLFNHTFLKNNRPLQFGSDVERLSSEVNILIRTARVTGQELPRILVCGQRDTGKSSLLRFLVNKILSVFLVAYYFDTDPGQSEFTPPGVVSLTKVTKPVIGPSFMHLKKPVSMMFTGSVSPTFIDMYTKSISKIMQLYNEKYSSEALFVNTMGWMEGTGLECLKYTINVVKPTVLIEIVKEDEISLFDYREHLPPDAHYYQIDCTHKPPKNEFSAREKREFSLLSHLSLSVPPYLGPQLLTEIRPYRVSWDDVAVFVFPEKSILPSRMIEAVNNSIVALCHVPESSILASNIPEFPKTLGPDPENECLGYGYVRAVDEVKNVLYIVSSLKTKDLENVNVIIKGDIMIPDSVTLNQSLYGVPLPYTCDAHDSGDDDEEENQMDLDCSMISLKYLSELESPPADRKSPAARPSVRKFSKKVTSRHSRSFYK